jgi:hypothetical protein
VELVFAAEREARIAAVFVTGKIIPEIPTPRTLTYIAGKRSDVATGVATVSAASASTAYRRRMASVAQGIQRDQTADGRAHSQL